MGVLTAWLEITATVVTFMSKCFIFYVQFSTHMHVRIVPEQAYVNDIFTCKILVQTGRSHANFSTVKISGTCESSEHHILLLKSVSTLIPLNTETHYTTVIPLYTLPTFSSKSFTVKYTVEVETYYKTDKSSFSKEFTVLPVCMSSHYKDVNRLHLLTEDMISIGNPVDTAFAKIMSLLRPEGLLSNLAATILTSDEPSRRCTDERLVQGDGVLGTKSNFGALYQSTKHLSIDCAIMHKHKTLEMMDFSGTMQDIVKSYKARSLGDPLYYIEEIDLSVENVLKKFDLGDVAKIAYRKILYKRQVFCIRYMQNIARTEISLLVVEEQNNRSMTKDCVLLSQTSTSGVKHIDIPLEYLCDRFYSLESRYFSVRFYYEVALDNTKVILPIIYVPHTSRIKFE